MVLSIKFTRAHFRIAMGMELAIFRGLFSAWIICNPWNRCYLGFSHLSFAHGGFWI